MGRGPPQGMEGSPMDFHDRALEPRIDKGKRVNFTARVCSPAAGRSIYKQHLTASAGVLCPAAAAVLLLRLLRFPIDFRCLVLSLFLFCSAMFSLVICGSAMDDDDLLTYTIKL